MTATAPRQPLACVSLPALMFAWLFLLAPAIGACFPYLLLRAQQVSPLPAGSNYLYAFINGGLLTLAGCAAAAIVFALLAADRSCAARNGER